MTKLASVHLHPAARCVIATCALRKRLADGIDLVVVSTSGEGEEFRLKRWEPWFGYGQLDERCLELCRLNGHAREFVACGLTAMDGRPSFLSFGISPVPTPVSSISLGRLMPLELPDGFGLQRGIV